ncbi:hypothetical protein [Luteimonas terricola]|uniref:hypothetical protein n=1 Tax=Luteimonas terricola TaxID=645597 RepID=UPI001051A461|nr:hypothetical protein [Luteimonas terricola]
MPEGYTVVCGQIIFCHGFARIHTDRAEEDEKLFLPRICADYADLTDARLLPKAQLKEKSGAEHGASACLSKIRVIRANPWQRAFSSAFALSV